MNKQTRRRVERTLKALGNGRRITIIWMLAGCKHISVGDVAEKLHISFPAASQHLRALENAELIERRRDMNMVYYHLRRDAPFVAETLRRLRGSK